MIDDRKPHIARVRPADGEMQYLLDHLEGVGEKAARFAAKIGAADAGRLIGLLHDFGKHSDAFQEYLKSAAGVMQPDEDGPGVKGMRGKVDHSTAGAQWIWRALRQKGRGGQGELCGQILALCIASHHSGLIDCLDPEGGQKFEESGFWKRMGKADSKSHFAECCDNASPAFVEKISRMADDGELIRRIVGSISDSFPAGASATVKAFYAGLWTRFLFSCLVDADRIDSADFEYPARAAWRGHDPEWDVAIARLETHLAGMPTRNAVDERRREVSDACRARAAEAQGLYSLTVPTGGGKTLASLRFALHHAKAHNLERVIHIVPFTTIIEQNAGAVREILEKETDAHPWVLEIHSNLASEKQTWLSKMTAENWDAPVIFTTMVQFLEALFEGGTRSVRRMHQLANAVIVFDEIQNLPINCVHIFCNALNFLSRSAGTTALLCTATQPLLHKLDNPEKGQLDLKPENELVPDTKKLFAELNRVKVVDRTRPEAKGWRAEEIAELAAAETREHGNCLVIVNTKRWAKDLYAQCRELMGEDEVFHLSADMYPRHRKAVLAEVKRRIAPEATRRTLCISTQLIEAGVDIDFRSVVRFLAGLDSIAQAAGRCNRHGLVESGVVHVVNPKDESIEQLTDIKEGRDKARRIFADTHAADLLTPETMQQYFRYYFFARQCKMAYRLTPRQAGGRGDSLLNILAENKWNHWGGHNQARAKQGKCPLLLQAFMTAGRAFKAIDAPTKPLIVQHGGGEEIVAKLCGEYAPGAQYALLKDAQGYSVNVFPHTWDKLRDAGAVHPVQAGEGIYYLVKQHYHGKFGVSVEPVPVDALVV